MENKPIDLSERFLNFAVSGFIQSKKIYNNQLNRHVAISIQKLSNT
jgi:hypothetical protein